MARNSHVLAGALPTLVIAEAELSRLAGVQGVQYDIAPFGAVRSQSDTTRIFGYREQEYRLYAGKERAAGRNPLSIEKWRPVAPFGNSHHNYGAAFDVRPVSWPQGKSFQWAHDKLDAIVAATPTLGLRSGDYFNDEPHFELALPLATVRQMWAATGKSVGVGATPVVVVGVLAILGLLFFAVTRK